MLDAAKTKNVHSAFRLQKNFKHYKKPKMYIQLSDYNKASNFTLKNEMKSNPLMLMQQKPKIHIQTLNYNKVSYFRNELKFNPLKFTFSFHITKKASNFTFQNELKIKPTNSNTAKT